MIVYITRPEAFEVYMGGKRHLDVWLQEPYYDHRPRADGDRYVETGWAATHCSPEPARFLLSQDEHLLDTVMEYVIMSLYPKGMDMDKGTYWSEKVNEEGDAGWRTLLTDREWEAKCNTCWKRFLLKVNLRTNKVDLVSPYVVLDDRSTVTTNEISSDLAIRRIIELTSSDIIPF